MNEVNMKKLKNSPIVYYTSGDKAMESILFVHAAFADHTSFNLQTEFFSESYYVITLDIIGHGKSTDTKKGDSIAKTADYIRKIMEEEGISKLHLAGVSIGAVLIQDFANKYPNKVASLCCIGGYDINNFDPSIQKGNTSEQMKMMLKAVFSIKWFAEDNKKISAYTKEAQEAFYQMNIRFPRKSFMYLASLNSLVNKQKTAKRNYSLLIGCGDHDSELELKAAAMWHEAEPESRFIIFKNAGHLVNMDIPEDFNRTYHNFILA